MSGHLSSQMEALQAVVDVGVVVVFDVGVVLELWCCGCGVVVL